MLNKVIPDTFFYQGGDGALVMDENLLDSAEVTSEDPQVVEYVINADAAWSDGDPIDCDDFYLQLDRLQRRAASRSTTPATRCSPRTA